MESYSAIKTLLKQKHFDKQNENLKQLGSKALDLLLAKISKIKLQKPKIYQSYHNKIAQFIIQQVGFSQPTHLLMCIGQIIRNDGYFRFPQIQCQLQMMLQSSDLPSMPTMSSKLNQMSLSQTKTSNSMLKILNNTQDGSLKDKYDQQQSNAEFHFDFLEELERQGKLELQKNKKSSSSKSNCQNNSFMSGSKVKFTKEVDIDNLSPEVYLKMYVKSFAAELNIFTQKFKKWEIILPQKWDEAKDQQGNSVQQFQIIIPSILNGSCKGSTKIHGKGKCSNKKDARNEAALIILRQLYTNYPNIFMKMLQIRQKQAIET